MSYLKSNWSTSFSEKCSFYPSIINSTILVIYVIESSSNNNTSGSSFQSKVLTTVRYDCPNCIHETRIKANDVYRGYEACIATMNLSKESEKIEVKIVDEKQCI